MRARTALFIAALLLCGRAAPQSAPPQALSPSSTAGQSQAGPPWGGPGQRRGPPAGRGLGAWWRNSEIVKQLSLTDKQTQEVERIFQEYRPQLFALHATLTQAESQLQPLVDAEHPNDGQVLTQIDKVADARAAVEKANSRMLFAIRQVLTTAQWQKLEQLGQGLGMGVGRGPGMGQGMGMGRGPGPL